MTSGPPYVDHSHSTPELRPDFPRLVDANKKGYQAIMSVRLVWLRVLNVFAYCQIEMIRESQSLFAVEAHKNGYQAIMSVRLACPSFLLRRTRAFLFTR